MQTDAKVNILMVDDQPENLLALEAILGDLGENLVRAHSGEEALRCLLYQDFAVILLDVQMPDMDGFEVASLIRRRERSRETPIIFLTAFSTSEQFMFRGYALGAVDYLIKPISANILVSKVAVFIELFRKTEALRQQAISLQQQAVQLEAMNAELQVSEERFRLLSTCSPVGVFVTDHEGYCVYTNPRFEAICGSGTQPNPCQDWLTAVHPEDQAQVKATWWAYLQGGQEYSQEVRFHGEETDQWAHIRAARMLSDQGTFLGHVGTIENITERKRAETANAAVIRAQAARQEAESANQMKDEFIAVLSHELRTPLNAILGWSRLLSSRSCDQATVSNALEIIHRNAISQAKLIEDILDVSQIVRGKLQLDLHPVDLAMVVRSALETVQSQAEAKAIAIVTQMDTTTSFTVMGDTIRLQQIVWNLLTNAIKFTPEGGQIEVTLTLGEDSLEGLPREITPSLQHAQIRVADTGRGISPDFLPHVFDRFRQGDSSTTRNEGGLGLGLAIVSHLIEQHHGVVQAESPGLGLGAIFTIKLPLLQAEQVNSCPNPISVQSQKQPIQDIRILVVDDDEDTRKFLTFLLVEEGAVVTTATSGVEALHVLETETPDILLCDISMPDMNGYTLIRKIRAEVSQSHSQIPAIALTAHARVSDQQEALAAGFQRHLPKPIHSETLVQSIAQLVRIYSFGQKA